MAVVRRTRGKPVVRRKLTGGPVLPRNAVILPTDGISIAGDRDQIIVRDNRLEGAIFVGPQEDRPPMVIQEGMFLPGGGVAGWHISEGGINVRGEDGKSLIGLGVTPGVDPALDLFADGSVYSEGKLHERYTRERRRAMGLMTDEDILRAAAKEASGMELTEWDKAALGRDS